MTVKNSDVEIYKETINGITHFNSNYSFGFGLDDNSTMLIQVDGTKKSNYISQWNINGCQLRIEGETLDKDPSAYVPVGYEVARTLQHGQ